MSITSKTGKYIEKIEKQRVNLANPKYELNAKQEICLNKAIELLNESEESLQTRSPQQMGRRIRVGKFLQSTFQTLGPELAFLCIISLSITELAEIQHLLQQPLSIWWEKSEKPKSLHHRARKALDQHVSAADITGPMKPIGNQPAVSHALSIASLKPLKRPFIEVEEPALEQHTAKARTCKQSRYVLAAGDGDGDGDGDGSGSRKVVQLPDGKLTGNVYQLTALDAIRIVVSDEKAAKNVLLTVPVYQETSPFIMIPLSEVLAMQFLTRRQLM